MGLCKAIVKYKKNSDLESREDVFEGNDKIASSAKPYSVFRTIKLFIESLNLFKEIRIHNKNDFFSNRFKSSQEKLGKFIILNN